MEAKLLLPDGRSDVEQLPSRRDKPPLDVSIAIATLVTMAVAACIFVMFLGLLALGLGLVDLPSPSGRRPVFSVAMGGFSNLEDRVPRAFNLTMGIENLRGKSEACVGGEAVVLYGGVPLAGCRVQDLCVPPKRSAELAIVAASGGLGLPKELGELMGDEKRAGGVAQVEVQVISPKHDSFVSCMASLARGAAPSPCLGAFLRDESDGVGPKEGGAAGFPF